MLTIHHVASLEGPELAPYRTLRQAADHQRQRLFVAEGGKVVERLIESDFGVISALVTEPWLETLTPSLAARRENIPVYVAPLEVMEKLTGFPLFQGVLAVGRFPEPRALETILGTSPRPHLLVAVEGVTSAENMGVLVRNSAAFGVQTIIVGETCASPFLRRAVRNSMGAVFKLPVVDTADLAGALHTLRSRRIRCIAAHPHTGMISLPECDLTDDCCIVVGSEGVGLSPAILAACDEAVAIPMHNGVDSLNVSNAAAVFLYEAQRQRQAGQPSKTSSNSGESGSRPSP